MGVAKFRNGRVHFRNSGVKGLKGFFVTCSNKKLDRGPAEKLQPYQNGLVNAEHDGPIVSI